MNCRCNISKKLPPISIIVFLFSAFLLLKISDTYASTPSDDNLVTLHIFSGKPNPVWKISTDDNQSLEKYAAFMSDEPEVSKLAYRGFSVSKGGLKKYIHAGASQDLEELLLSTATDVVSEKTKRLVKAQFRKDSVEPPSEPNIPSSLVSATSSKKVDDLGKTKCQRPEASSSTSVGGKPSTAASKFSDHSDDDEEVKSDESALLPGQASAPSVLRPVSDIVIPEEARGYEDVYRRFLGGKLIYTDPTSKAKTELPIRALASPLEGTFDLSGCGDTSTYLSISTGYRKGLKAENASKVEIWLAPWFLVNKNLSASARHLQPIMGSWDAAKAPVGLFWTYGGWGNEHYGYLFPGRFDLAGCEDLYEKAKEEAPQLRERVLENPARPFQVLF